jgi:cytochrome c2
MGSHGNVVFSEPIWIGHRIRDVVQFNDRLVLLTDDLRIIFITVESSLIESNRKNDGLHFELEIQSCLACHSFGPTTPASIAPSLGSVVGRRIGVDNFDRYTDSLKLHGGTWDKDSLVQFLANSSEFIPGTSMPNLNLSVSAARKIVDILEK